MYLFRENHSSQVTPNWQICVYFVLLLLTLLLPPGFPFSCISRFGSFAPALQRDYTLPFTLLASPAFPALLAFLGFVNLVILKRLETNKILRSCPKWFTVTGRRNRFPHFQCQVQFWTKSIVFGMAQQKWEKNHQHYQRANLHHPLPRPKPDL